jgi:acyl carrier protein
VVLDSFSGTNSSGTDSGFNSAAGGDLRGKTEEAIQAWLIARLAKIAGSEPSRIDVRKSFDCYGLDSLAAVEITTELEEWLGCSLSPTLLYEHPTIQAAAQQVVTELERAR